MITLQDVIADADLKRLERLVFDAFVEIDAEIDRGARVDRGAFALVPNYGGIGEVLEIDQLHPEDQRAAKGWFSEQWRRASQALMDSDAYLGDSLRLGAA